MARLSSTTAEPVRASELGVERRDWGQSITLLEMQRRDRGLQHVRPLTAQRDRAVERAAARADLRRVPAAAILGFEQHDLVGYHARVRRASCSSISASRP